MIVSQNNERLWTQFQTSRDVASIRQIPIFRSGSAYRQPIHQSSSRHCPCLIYRRNRTRKSVFSNMFGWCKMWTREESLAGRVRCKDLPGHSAEGLINQMVAWIPWKLSVHEDSTPAVKYYLFCLDPDLLSNNLISIAKSVECSQMRCEKTTRPNKHVESKIENEKRLSHL